MRTSKMCLLALCALTATAFLPATIAGSPATGQINEFTAATRCNESQLERLEENILSPQLNPQAEVCTDIHGSCATTTTQKTTITGEGVNLIFYVKVTITESTEVTTTISCSGYYNVDVFHYGGSGVRLGYSKLLANAGASGGDAGFLDLGDNSAVNQNGQASGCTYVAPVGDCKEPTIQGSWSYEKVLKGKLEGVTGEWTACAKLEVHNDNAASASISWGGTPDDVFASSGPGIFSGSGSAVDTREICGVVARASGDTTSLAALTGDTGSIALPDAPKNEA